MSPLSQIATAFVSISLLSAVWEPTFVTAAVSLGSMILMGAIIYLEKSSDDEVSKIRKELADLKSSVQALMVRAGFGR